jgi:ring-1,2-phenylacetyl-CoA epoxidase subunit PaaD
VIRRVLETVTDPEIPVVNVIEMGIIADVRIEADGVIVDMTPTFVGCPALDVIRESIRAAVTGLGETDVTVNVVFDPPWTTDRINESGRRKLKEFGLAPPGERCSATGSPDLERVACPHCDSSNTELESLFGPTLCRSIHYCHDCLQSFEHFKSV